NLSTAAAGLTGLHAAFIFCTVAAASATGNVFFYLNIFGNAFGDFFISEFQLYAQITSAYTARSLSTAASLLATKKVSEYIVSKYIPKLAEYIIHIHSATTKSTSSRSAAYARMTITIVLRALIRIAQYLV